MVVIGQWYGNAELLADLLRLAQNHLQHCTVDRIVGAIHQGRADRGAGLAKAVHAAFALLVASGIPRKVVMDHGVELFLQVDALGQAVGRDQQTTRGFAQRFDAALALLGREFAGDRVHGNAAELAIQMLAQVVGGGDVSTEHHRVEAVGDELLKVLGEQAQLGIALLARQLAGLGQQCMQVGVARISSRRHVVLIQRVLAAVEQGFQHLLRGVIHLPGKQAGLKRLYGCGGAGSHAAHQRQRAPEAQALAAGVIAGALHDVTAVVEHVLEEAVPVAAEVIDGLANFSLWEDAAVAPFIDVRAATLDEVLGELFAQLVLVVAAGRGELGEHRLEQGQQAVKGILVAAVRGRREQH